MEHKFQLPGVKYVTSQDDADLAKITPIGVTNVTLDPDTNTGNTACTVYYNPHSRCDPEVVELIVSVWYSGLLTDEVFYDRYPEFKQSQDSVEGESYLIDAKAETDFLNIIKARCEALYKKRVGSVSA